MNEIVVVSRHLGAIEWCGGRLGMRYSPFSSPAQNMDTRAVQIGVLVEYPTNPEKEGSAEIPVFSSVTPAEIRGKEVWGNIPLDMAAEAAVVVAILFPPGRAPRGGEYTCEDMVKAAAFTQRFTIFSEGDQYDEFGEILKDGFGSMTDPELIKKMIFQG